MRDSVSFNALFNDERSSAFDLICLSHLRWDFVYQRPQHLLSRCASQHRVFFVEEPIFIDGPARLRVSQRHASLYVVTPLLPKKFAFDQKVTDPEKIQRADERFRHEIDALQRQMLDELIATYTIESYVLWYYTPMALSFSEHLTPTAIVYDCMDELSLFKNAPAALQKYEAALFERANVVFTGGQSLYEAKRHLHRNVHAFPSSVDASHFLQARSPQQDPSDQAQIPHPRLGFYGVIDERFNIELLRAVAEAQPDWHIILLGPVAKIDPEDLPDRKNIHYLGAKSYSELPYYLAGWDVALLPFAHNDATRFISPTKTLEYLTGGKAVVSTSIRDVVVPYGLQGLVHIADTPEEFIAAIKKALNEEKTQRIVAVDSMLVHTSWDMTWNRMQHLIEDVVTTHRMAKTLWSEALMPSSQQMVGELAGEQNNV